MNREFEKRRLMIVGMEKIIVSHVRHDLGYIFVEVVCQTTT